MTCLQHSYEICVLWSMLQEVWSYFGLDEIECLLDVFITWITYSSVVIVARAGFRVSQTAFDILTWCISAMVEWKLYVGLWCKSVAASSPFRFVKLN